MNAEFTEMLRPFLKFAGDKEITEESRLRDLGLDSMREIELLFAIEDTFGVAVPDDKLVDSTFATAGGLWHVVEELRTPVGGGAR
ncbi:MULTISPECIES: phosphopantetheine-binding protein [unclassified Micromonospora]|uniref:phosphopantetheine-binding protein n=1 Tax=unclassified Micromonospora TaxID=2617518 RepID=UPI0037903F6E